jgi:hypothetical protein
MEERLPGRGLKTHRGRGRRREGGLWEGAALREDLRKGIGVL